MGQRVIALSWLILVLLFAVSSGNAQTCETFADKPSYCKALISYQVYVPPGLTQDDLAASLVNLTNAQCQIPSPCRIPSLQCDSNATVPEPICRDICDNFNTQCASIISAGFAKAVDCNAMDPFAPSSPYFTPGGSTQSCGSANSTSDVPCGATLTCPAPLVVNFDTLNCDLKCPPPGMDDPTVQRRWQVTGLVLFSIACICELVAIITWIAIYDPKRPIYVLCFVVAMFIQNFGTWIGKWLPFHEWMCTTVWKIRGQGDTAGAIQALFAFYGALVTASWLVVLLYHLLNSVWENKFQIFGPGRLIPIRTEIGYHFCGWVVFGVPLTVTMFAGGWASCDSGWVVFPTGIPHGGWVLYGLMMILYVMTMVLIVLLLYRIISVAGYAGIRSQIRLLALCVVYSMSLGYGVIYAWVRYADLDETRDRLKAYVTCQASTGINCGSPPDLLGGGRGLGSMVFTAVPGILSPFILLDVTMLGVWKRWFTCKGFFLHDTTSTGGTSRSGSDDRTSSYF